MASRNPTLLVSGIPEATTLPGLPIAVTARRAWTLASRLAQRNGLSDLIRPLSGQGLGFLLSDVPGSRPRRSAR